jgi:sugar transferase (PEP-CTERM system associated)
LLVATDSGAIVLGLMVATALRFLSSGSVRENIYSSAVALRFLVVVLMCELALYYNELYDSRIGRRRVLIFVQLLQALGIAWVALAVLYYAEPELTLGRGVAALAAPTILALILASRLLLREASEFIDSSDRVLIVGTGHAGISLVHEILDRPELGLKVVGFLDEKGENIGKSLVNPGIIGAVSEIEDIVAKEKIDRVVLSLLERRGRTPLLQLLRLKFAGVYVEDAYSSYEKVTGRILLEHLSPSFLILSEGFRRSSFVAAAKRAMDIVLSLLALLLTLPAMGIMAVGIWLETGTPVLFRQKRVGLWGRQFEMLKFRSMYRNAEAEGPRWAEDSDRRVTRVGCFIRKYRLDELPQLFNVLRGDMSLVGPRPEQPYFCALLEQKFPIFCYRHSVRPGITGWAQIKYQYGSSIDEAKKKLEFDLFYIKHFSVLMDLAILFETVKVMLLGRGAK